MLDNPVSFFSLSFLLFVWHSIIIVHVLQKKSAVKRKPKITAKPRRRTDSNYSSSLFISHFIVVVVRLLSLD